jgi:FdrA protein
MSWTARVLRDRYVDSVRLMQVAQAVRGSDGVAGCELVMGTAANLDALRARGIDCEATPADVVIAVEGPAGALDLAERELVAVPAATAREEVAQPRSLGAAARELNGANVALISVPGEYAVLEAHRALTLGLHVFLFSDHVGVADEVALKRRGAELGLLVMGPGCGTAMLGGTGLGFANVVRPGPIGIVAAAGTGAQEVAVLVDSVGVSQIVGVGGRDLTSEVGALMFREGMRALAADDATETLLLVSKPPDRDAVQALADVDVRGKRVVAAFVGWDGGDAPFEVHPTLEAGAWAAAGLDPAPEPDPPRGRGGKLLGLFSGGSLAHEAVTILAPTLGAIGGNAGGDAGEHRVLDLGEEEYTQGRPHPMVDLGVRLEMLRDVPDDVGCVLLDVVLGHGSHADPAGELAPVLAELRCPVIAHVCGTEADPQNAPRQQATLREAGAIVAPTNASAARVAAQVTT